MKLDRMFIELHDGDDLVLIDVDAIHALVGETNTTVFFTGYPDGFIVDETPRDVAARIHEAYVKAATARRGGGLADTRSADDKIMGYPR